MVVVGVSLGAQAHFSPYAPRLMHTFSHSCVASLLPDGLSHTLSSNTTSLHSQSHSLFLQALKSEPQYLVTSLSVTAVPLIL